MNKAEFQNLIVEAFESLPPQFKEKLENVDIVLEEGLPKVMRKGGVLLGLYRGIPLKKRSIWYNAALPDKIIIYKNTIEGICKNEFEIRERIKDVLYHEIGHHFGLTEEQLRSPIIMFLEHLVPIFYLQGLWIKPGQRSVRGKEQLPLLR